MGDGQAVESVQHVAGARARLRSATFTEITAPLLDDTSLQTLNEMLDHYATSTNDPDDKAATDP